MPFTKKWKEKWKVTDARLSIFTGEVPFDISCERV
jgi:hypothetical protein